LHSFDFSTIKAHNGLEYEGLNTEFVFDVKFDGSFISYVKASDCNYVSEDEARVIYIPSNIMYDLNLQDITKVERFSFDFYNEITEENTTL